MKYLFFISFIICISLSCSTSKSTTDHTIQIMGVFDDTISEAGFIPLTILPYVGERKDTFADIDGQFTFKEDVYGVLIMGSREDYPIYLKKNQILKTTTITMESIKYPFDEDKYNNDPKFKKVINKIQKAFKRWRRLQSK
ncbi:MAG: hypothetical protein H3C31_09065 [Brumimicrobium sp.]|nr:hypothetical protein [Brumimicrobium sp.]